MHWYLEELFIILYVDTEANIYIGSWQQKPFVGISFFIEGRFMMLDCKCAYTVKYSLAYYITYYVQKMSGLPEISRSTLFKLFKKLLKWKIVNRFLFFVSQH